MYIATLLRSYHVTRTKKIIGHSEWCKMAHPVRSTYPESLAQGLSPDAEILLRLYLLERPQFGHTNSV